MDLVGFDVLRIDAVVADVRIKTVPSASARMAGGKVP